ncbi:prostate-specific antigen-like [Octodon degus]|uniref:Prostate-specific antigen-like n=1 Tax=Octodon degus TaxID=10160 RepID=A0A6P6DQQ7_OCTDE|nr:prostate-specific antigen-like [Octodon degus]
MKPHNSYAHDLHSHDLMLAHPREPAQISDSLKDLELPTKGPAVRRRCFMSGRRRADKCTLGTGQGGLRRTLGSESWRVGTLGCRHSPAPPWPADVSPDRLQCVDFKVPRQAACDLGGPLICNGVLQDLMSWGSDPCGQPGKPTLYTKLVAYRKWIKDHPQ